MKRKFVLLYLFLMLSVSLFPYTANAQDESFSLAADNESPAVGQKFQVTVTGDHLTDVYGYELNLTFDSKRLRFVKVDNSLTGFSVPMTPKDGKLVYAHTKIGKVSGENGKAVLATFTFEPIGTSKSPTPIKLTRVELVKSDLTVSKHDTNVNLEIVPVGQPVSFKDINGHWAKEAIERAAGIGFVNGYTDGTFRPERNVTRAEFIAMLSRAIELKSKGVPVIEFADQADIPDWARTLIAEAQSAGIVTGYQDGTFRPNSLINRTEMAAMVMRTLDIKLDEQLNLTFADTDSIAVWARPSVAAAVEAGLINGRSNNRFAPEANATRAEAVVLILRLIDYKDLMES